MRPAVEPSDTVRFGDFEVDLRAGELLKRGHKIKLQEKPFQILEILLEQPGDMVSRHELAERLWPADTFVDFERGLNTAIGKLRTALGDSAEKPRYVETVARRGYRFIGSIEPPAGLSERPSSNRKTAFVAVVAATVVALMAAYLLLGRAPAPTPTSTRPRIVVLPFENLEQPEDHYFADGMTQEITSRLAIVRAIGVISRNSANKYRNSDKGTKQIGEVLGVDFILEGTVRWQEGQVRVTPQLIRISDDTQIWSEPYDGVTDDVFGVQSDIARGVIEQLGISLVASEQKSLDSPPTADPDAYQAYVRGLSHLWSPGVAQVEESSLAIESLEKAVELDPGFAKAYAELAVAHTWFYRHDPSPQRLELAEQAVAKAFDLEPDLAEAHLAQGLIYHQGKDYPRALEQLAIAANGIPNGTRIALLMAMVKQAQGHLEEALEQSKQAYELDPRNEFLATFIAVNLGQLRRYAEADRYLALLLTIAPGQFFTHVYIAINSWAKGDLEGARDALTSLPDQSQDVAVVIWWRQLLMERRIEEALGKLNSAPQEAFNLATWFYPKALLIANTYDLLGETGRADSAYADAVVVLERELEERPKDPRIHSALGIAHAGLGRAKEAVKEGQEAVKLAPVEVNILRGRGAVHNLALIYTMLGDHEAALEELDTLLSIPSGTILSVPHLELDPLWDSLREHPGYRELVEKHSRPDPGTS